MFERFTERARQVVVLAQEEARRLRHDYIGTEHILLGLLREEEGLAARVLESLDIRVEEVRAEIAQIVGQGDEVATGQIPFTPRAKKVLEHGLREASELGHNYVGTEHLLLGLVRMNEGVARRVLLDFDADARKIRNEIVRVLAGPGRRQPDAAEAAPEAPSARLFTPELTAEIERLRAKKEALIEAGEFERAAHLRDRERRLNRRAREIEEILQETEWPLGSVGDQPEVRARGCTPVRVADYASPRELPHLVAIVLAAAAFPLGLLVGWLIWG